MTRKEEWLLVEKYKKPNKTNKRELLKNNIKRDTLTNNELQDTDCLITWLIPLKNCMSLLNPQKNQNPILIKAQADDPLNLIILSPKNYIKVRSRVQLNINQIRHLYKLTQPFLTKYKLKLSLEEFITFFNDNLPPISKKKKKTKKKKRKKRKAIILSNKKSRITPKMKVLRRYKNKDVLYNKKLINSTIIKLIPMKYKELMNPLNNRTENVLVEIIKDPINSVPVTPEDHNIIANSTLDIEGVKKLYKLVKPYLKKYDVTLTLQEFTNIHSNKKYNMTKRLILSKTTKAAVINRYDSKDILTGKTLGEEKPIHHIIPFGKRSIMDKKGKYVPQKLKKISDDPLNLVALNEDTHVALHKPHFKDTKQVSILYKIVKPYLKKYKVKLKLQEFTDMYIKK